MSNSFKPRIQHLRGDALELQTIGSEFIPLDGEIILEKQNDGSYLQKIGNGLSPYRDLPYSGIVTENEVWILDCGGAN